MRCDDDQGPHDVERAEIWFLLNSATFGDADDIMASIGELEGFEQCWLTGTAAEVTPVGQIGDYTFEVGALARDIAESYEKLVRA